MAKKVLNVDVYVNEKADQDVIAWLDTISELRQSRAIWYSALMVAFKEKIKLETGCPTTSHSPLDTTTSPNTPRDTDVIESLDVDSDVTLGVDFSHVNDYAENVHKEHSGKRDKRGRLRYQTSITNPYIIKVYEDLSDDGYVISRVIREMIRRGFSYNYPDEIEARKVIRGKQLKRSVDKIEVKIEKRKEVPDEELKKPEINPMAAFIR